MKRNNYNRLLDALDGIFGFNDQIKSTFRKIRQFHDERTNEDVVIIAAGTLLGPALLAIFNTLDAGF